MGASVSGDCLLLLLQKSQYKVDKHTFHVHVNWIEFICEHALRVVVFSHSAFYMGFEDALREQRSMLISFHYLVISSVYFLRRSSSCEGFRIRHAHHAHSVAFCLFVIMLLLLLLFSGGFLADFGTARLIGSGYIENMFYRSFLVETTTHMQYAACRTILNIKRTGRNAPKRI